LPFSCTQHVLNGYMLRFSLILVILLLICFFLNMSSIHYAVAPDHTGAPQYPCPQVKPSNRTAPEKKDMEAAQKKRRENIQADIEKWITDTDRLAERMATDYGHTPRYFLDKLFFRQTGQHTKTNAWNAFISQKALEVNASTSYRYCFHSHNTL
jgi:hypothetical protein